MGRECEGRLGAEVEEICDEIVGGSGADLDGGANLLDHSTVDEDNAVGDFEGFVLIVGDEESGEVGAVVEFAQPAAEVLADFGVECTERLVEQEDLRFDGESAGEGDSLALSTRELGGEAFFVAAELDGFEEG